MARYAVDLMADRLGVALPWATLAINVVGCVLMGILVSYVLAHPARHLLWRPFLGVGVLGGFTTFSAFSLELMLLIERGQAGTALSYAAISVLAGLTGLYIGLIAMRLA